MKRLAPIIFLFISISGFTQNYKDSIAVNSKLLDNIIEWSQEKTSDSVNAIIVQTGLKLSLELKDYPSITENDSVTVFGIDFNDMLNSFSKYASQEIRIIDIYFYQNNIKVVVAYLFFDSENGEIATSHRAKYPEWYLTRTGATTFEEK